MDQLLNSSPVTLIVKAPDQKVDDHKVACCLNWTVKKLKEHLAESYPSKPKEDQQRLIYSGKLLHDHLRLRDVIRQFEEKEKDDQCHTVHLVCSSSTHSDHRNEPKLKVTQSQPGFNPYNSPTDAPQSPLMAGQDGLHYRGAGSPHVQAEAFQQMYGASPMYTNYYQMMQQAATAPYSPHQVLAMQQLYAQQMAQYMQLVQQGAIPTPPSTPGVATQAVPQPDPNLPAAAANQNPANNQRAGGNNQNMVMNAQGGAMFQEEDEEANRDWLDWVYTLSRFTVLLSIVYFYSTLSRFLMVLGFFVLVYIYEAGWLRPRRREGANGNVQQQQQQQQQQPEEEQNDNPTEIQDPPAENPTPEDSSEEDGQAEPATPPRPHPVKIAWNFFSGFFSSLIPQQPQAVNLN